VKHRAGAVRSRIYIRFLQCYEFHSVEESSLRQRLDQLFLALQKRTFLPAVCLVAFIIWVVLCSKHYDSYWIGTIHRVQTVDFNMLHHTLPATLSYLVMTGQDESIQRVLDSNYGLFGMVVTDPKGENIVYKTEKNYKDRMKWQPLLNIDFLNKTQLEKGVEHFDVLTDPPPTHVQWANESPRDASDKEIAPQPKGRVIGRVYYVREPPPEFWSDVMGAMGSNWFEMSGSKRGYVLQTLNILAGSMVVILTMLLRKQALVNKEKELLALERELTTKRRSLEQLTADLTAQRKRKEWLEVEADRAYQRALRLKQSLEKLKEAFFFNDSAPRGGKESPISVRPPLHPPSALIEEMETLLPELTNNAKILRSQAEVLQSYCSQLESRQVEMQRILERGTSGRAEAVQQAQAQFQAHMASKQSAP